jgi:hypothetical protein
MKVISRIVIVLAAVALMASLPAGATCALASSWYGDYFTGTNGDPTTAIGAFWGVGEYVAASPGGHDNGTAAPGDNSLGTAWLRGGGDFLYIAGDWAGDARYDGCVQTPPDNPQPARMAFAISMPGSAPGSTVYFGGCAVEDISGNFTFATGADVVSAPIPKPVVTGTSRAPGNVTVTLAGPPVGGGLADEAGCNLGVTSYRIYTQNVDRDDPAPSSRERNTWIAGSAATPTASPTTLTVPCATDQDVYLSYSLLITDADGASVELGHVGANSTVVQCGATSAEPPRNFKIIKKPIKTKTN